MKRSILSELLCFFKHFSLRITKIVQCFFQTHVKLMFVCLFVCLFVCFCKCIFEKEKSAGFRISLNTPGKWHLYVSLHFLCTIIFCRPFLGISKNIKFLVLNAYESVYTIPLTSLRIILNTGLSITHVLCFLY